MAKFKGIEKILKAEWKTVIYKSAPMRMSAEFSTETFQARKILVQNIQRDEKQGSTAKTTLPMKVIYNWRRERELIRQEKTKGIHYHQTSITRNLKGSSLSRRRKQPINMNNKIAITSTYK